MSTIALCVPAYNAERYLNRLLVSAKNQIIAFDEIYVYNDCSTDNTAIIAEANGATVINGDVNRGCSFGKNKLAEIVNSEWLHFHDADDELLPNFTSLAHKWISKENCPPVVLFDYEYRDHETGELISLRKFNNSKLKKDPISYAIREQINPFCGLYHRESFIRAGGCDIDPAVLYNEDTAFHISLALFGLKFSSESDVSIINYRISNSMSQRNKGKCFIAQYHVMKKTAKKVQSNYERELAEKFWEIAIQLATIREWEMVNSCVQYVSRYGLIFQSVEKNILFVLLCKVSPFGAIWLRENIIRIIKPELRK